MAQALRYSSSSFPRWTVKTLIASSHCSLETSFPSRNHSRLAFQSLHQEHRDFGVNGKNKVNVASGPRFSVDDARYGSLYVVVDAKLFDCSDEPLYRTDGFVQISSPSRRRPSRKLL